MAPKPYRTSSELSTASTATNSSTSSASSATLQCTSPSPASPSTSFFSRMRTSRSRSPQPRSATTSAIPSPAQHRPERLHLRTDSGLSATSPTTSPRTRSRPAKRNSTGTVMQVGRHGNEWLFGGFSFTNTVRGLLSPTDSESGQDRQ